MLLPDAYIVESFLFQSIPNPSSISLIFEIYLASSPFQKLVESLDNILIASLIFYTYVCLFSN